jgi:receptor protein-tyrosine kinase
MQKDRVTDDLSDRLVTMLDPTSVASEAYRTLRTNLLYSFLDAPPKVIVLTSASPKEGKSTTCANLGVVLAQAGKRTLILDCDLRKPVIHKIFAVRNIHGLIDVLMGERRVQEVWHQPMPQLNVVTAGRAPINPAEVLGSRRFAAFLTEVREEFDHVLIDASPVGLVSDPSILATQGDGVLLVLDAQNTRKASLRKSMRSLETVGANILGTVMNNVTVSKRGSGYEDYATYTYG